jgi:hypothetical protein
MWGGSPPPQAPSLHSEISQAYYTGAVGPDGKPEDFWRGNYPGRYGYGKKSAKKSKRSSKKSKKTKKSKKRSTKRSKKRSIRR